MQRVALCTILSALLSTHAPAASGAHLKFAFGGESRSYSIVETTRRGYRIAVKRLAESASDEGRLGLAEGASGVSLAQGLNRLGVERDEPAGEGVVDQGGPWLRVLGNVQVETGQPHDVDSSATSEPAKITQATRTMYNQSLID